MPQKILCSIFEAVMDDYRIDESQWMKHIKPSLKEDCSLNGKLSQDKTGTTTSFNNS